MDAELRAALREEAQREMGRRNLLDYCRLIDARYETPKHIEYLAALLERVDRGEIQKLAISASVRHGKSKLVARWVSWWLHRAANRHLLLVSSSESLSVRNSKWIRTDVMSERYPWDVRISEDSSSVLNWTTTGGASVRALSVNSTVTGFQADACVLDDVQPDMMTAGTRDSLESFLRGVLETRLEPGAPTILINSRWGTDDIFARLVEQGEDADAWTSVNLEAICETQPDPLGREIGEALWPQRWSVPLLQAKRKSVGVMIFEAQYQGHPVFEHGRLVNVADIKEYDLLPKAPVVEWNPLWNLYVSPFEAARPNTAEQFIKITAADTSGCTTRTGASGSFNALVTVMLDTATGNVYILDVVRSRGIPFEELRSQTVQHLAYHGSDLFVVENGANGGRLAEATRGMVRTPIVLVEPRDSKENRLLSVINYIEGGRVFWPPVTRAPWRPALESELRDFPAGKYSDQTDALVYCLMHCKTALARRRGDELFEEQLRMLEGGIFSR